MARRRKKGKEPVGMNTTTMVDVLFILLIFFIVVSEIRDSSVDVDLPEIDKDASETETVDQSESRPLTLTIDATNGIHLQGEAVADADDLRARLEAEKAKMGDFKPTVLLRTDKESKSATLVQVISILSEVGFESLQFDVENAGPGGPTE